MTIGEALLCCFISGFLMYLLAQLYDDVRKRRWEEEDRRKRIRRQFEQEMWDLRDRYGDDFGEVRMIVKHNKKGAA